MRDAIIALPSSLFLMLAPAVLAQDAPAPTPAVAPTSADAAAPAGPQVKVLQALVMEVKGKAQWSGDGGTTWQPMKVHDLLPAGAMIQTGMRSSAALRVGRNATMLIDSVSSVSLPEIVEDGTTLRTRAGLKRGQADIKVDQAGLTNDFEVITPTSVISVRGTDYSVRYGGLEGTSVDSADTNRLRAIEVRYMALATKHMLDGNTKTSDVHQDPAVKAMFASTGPTPMKGTFVESGRLTDLQDHSFAHDLFVNQTYSISQAPQPSAIFGAYATPDQIQQFLTTPPGSGAPSNNGSGVPGPKPGSGNVIAPHNPPGHPIGDIIKKGGGYPKY
jgi:hypothetical protein